MTTDAEMLNGIADAMVFLAGAGMSNGVSGASVNKFTHNAAFLRTLASRLPELERDAARIAEVEARLTRAHETLADAAKWREVVKIESWPYAVGKLLQEIADRNNAAFAALAQMENDPIVSVDDPFNPKTATTQSGKEYTSTNGYEWTLKENGND